MGKLIKYELKKQRTSRMIIMVMLIIAIATMALGFFLDNSVLIAICLLILLIGAPLVLLYTGIESILVLNKDLRTKQSYMLWMLPKSVWEILGAKFISAVLQMLFVFAIFIAAGCIGLGISLIEIGGIRDFANAVTDFLNNITQFSVSWVDGIMFAASIFVAWMEVIFSGFLAVILSRTLLLNSRFSGLVATILFFIFIFIIEKGYSLISQIPGIDGFDLPGGWNIWDIIYYIVISLILFSVSCWFADRKLSV